MVTAASRSSRPGRRPRARRRRRAWSSPCRRHWCRDRRPRCGCPDRPHPRPPRSSVAASARAARGIAAEQRLRASASWPVLACTRAAPGCGGTSAKSGGITSGAWRATANSSGRVRSNAALARAAGERATAATRRRAAPTYAFTFSACGSGASRVSSARASRIRTPTVIAASATLKTKNGRHSPKCRSAIVDAHSRKPHAVEDIAERAAEHQRPAQPGRRVRGSRHSHTSTPTAIAPVTSDQQPPHQRAVRRAAAPANPTLATKRRSKIGSDRPHVAQLRRSRAAR